MQDPRRRARGGVPEPDVTDRLVRECLAAIERDGVAALATFCAAHPMYADEIGRRVERLAAYGLVLPAPQRRFGEYEVLGELGRGAMGVVYRARDHRLRRDVALKVLPPITGLSQRARERFLREANAVAQLRHPGIVTLYQLDDLEGQLFLVMEHADGCTLAQLVARLRDIGTPGGLSIDDVRAAWREASRLAGENTAGVASELVTDARSHIEFALRIAAEVAEALAHAHAHGVVHRDVKPSNVLVRGDGRALLCDFGLAHVADDPRITMTGQFLGTAAYAAPEQLAGANADPRSDVYSLGATLYEAVTLEVAFEGRNPAEIAQRIARGRPPSLRRANPCLSRDAETVCLRALEAAPSDRYTSAAAFGQDLRNLLSGRAVRARPAGVLRRSVRRCRRRPWSVAAAIVSLAIAVAFVVQSVQQAALRHNALASALRAAAASVDRAEAASRDYGPERAIVAERMAEAERTMQALRPALLEAAAADVAEAQRLRDKMDACARDRRFLLDYERWLLRSGFGSGPVRSRREGRAVRACLVDYGLDIANLADDDTRRAVSEAVRRSPIRNALTRGLGRLYTFEIKSGRRDAAESLANLLQACHDDPERAAMQLEIGSDDWRADRIEQLAACSRSPDELADLTSRLAAVGRIERAVELVERAVAMFPSHYALLLQRGRCAERVPNCDWQRVAELYRAAIAADPSRPASWVLLGRALWSAGRYDDALGWLREGAQRFPDVATLRYWIAASLHRKGGKDSEACAELRQAVAIEPEFVDAWHLLASLVPAREERMRLLQRARTVDPAYGDALRDLAAELAAEQRVAEAIEVMEDVMRVTWASAADQSMLAKLLARAERYAEAGSHHRYAAELGFEPPQSWCAAATCWRRAGDWYGAAWAVARAIGAAGPMGMPAELLSQWQQDLDALAADAVVVDALQMLQTLMQAERSRSSNDTAGAAAAWQRVLELAQGRVAWAWRLDAACAFLATGDLSLRALAVQELRTGVSEMEAGCAEGAARSRVHSEAQVWLHRESLGVQELRRAQRLVLGAETLTTEDQAFESLRLALEQLRDRNHELPAALR